MNMKMNKRKFLEKTNKQTNLNMQSVQLIKINNNKIIITLHRQIYLFFGKHFTPFECILHFFICY